LISFRFKIASQNQKDSIARKDAALVSFENEVEELNKKVKSLSKHLINRQVITQAGEDPFEAIDRLNSDKIAAGESMGRVSNELKLMTERVEGLKHRLERSEQELAEAKGKLGLTEGTLESQMNASQSKATLNEIHKIWHELGVDTSLREQTHKEIQDSVKRTCASKLKEARLLRDSTEKEVKELSDQLRAMRKALGILSVCGNERSCATLLEECRWLHEQVGKLQMPYNLACTRHKNIVEAATRLSKALALSNEDLPENLRYILERSKGFDSRSLILGRKRRASVMKDVKMMVDALSHFDEHEDKGKDSQLDIISPSRPKDQSEDSVDDIPTGILDGAILERCEAEISRLRVKKSELLVRNREMQQDIFHFLRDMHMSTGDMVNKVEHSLQKSENSPEWWNKQEAEIIMKRGAACAGQEAEIGESPYIQAIFEVVKRIGEQRRSLSATLRTNVERAQNALLNIVGRELDVSEAYASFHHALVKLPPLSMDLALACASEMEALVLGVESMAQSEIEALTVVWEALNVSSEKRRDFWGRVENSVSSLESDKSTSLFHEFLPLEDEEDWVGEVIHRARAYCKDLDMKLKKLREIHEEVERLRSKQDKKSQILTLDSEIRILNSKFIEFEETKCSKQRLLTKKSTGSVLLKEERFRKQMQSKFVVKLGQLSTLLRSWEEEERKPFEASLLSDDVRMLLQEPQSMEKWVEKRTKFMPLRTVQTNTPGRKRPLQGTHDSTNNVGSAFGHLPTSSDATPQKKRMIRSAAKPLQQPRSRSKPSEAGGGYAEGSDTRTVVPSNRTEVSRVLKRPNENNAQPNQVAALSSSSHLDERVPRSVRKPAKRQKRKESSTIPPFGNILTDGCSPQR
jgi:hypothetical protein